MITGTPPLPRPPVVYLLLSVPWLVAAAVSGYLTGTPVDAAGKATLDIVIALVVLLMACCVSVLLLPATTAARRRAIGYAAGCIAPLCAVIASQSDNVHSVAFIAACVGALGTTVAAGWRGVFIGVAGVLAVTLLAPAIAGAPASIPEAAYALTIVLTVTVLPVVYIVRSLQRATMRTLAELPGFASASDSARQRVTPHHAESLAVINVDGDDARMRAEALSRYLRQVRDTLVVADAVYWRAERSGAALTPVAWASNTVAEWSAKAPTVGATLGAVQSAVQISLFSDVTEGAMAAVAVPGAGQAVGVLSLHAPQLSTTSEVLSRWLPRFAENLGMLAQLLETQTEYGRQNRQTQALLHASQTFQQQRTIDALGQAICDAALTVSGATRAALVRWYPETTTGVIQSITSAHHAVRGAPVATDSLVGELCAAGLPQLWEDALLLEQVSPVYNRALPVARLGSLCIVPLRQSDAVTGAIVVESDAVGGILLRDMRNVRLLAAVASVSLETVWQIEEATRRSRTDALTGLANRRAFDDALARAIAEADRFGHNVGLVICDVDNFKRVNDMFGHEVGDQVLRSIAASLSAGVRGVDMVARYGGEELVMLLGKADVAMAWEVAERMRSALEVKTHGVGEHLIHVTASFGVASYPETARLGDELFPAADKALYAAKREGRNCVRFARPLSSEPASEEEGMPEDGEEYG